MGGRVVRRGVRVTADYLLSTDYACAEIAVAPGAAAKRNGEA